MNIHKNARLTPLGREGIVKEVLSGLTPEAAARAAGVCPRTVRKWVKRYLADGPAGLHDRSSRPHRLYRPTPERRVAIVAGEHPFIMRPSAVRCRCEMRAKYALMSRRSPSGKSSQDGPTNRGA